MNSHVPMLDLKRKYKHMKSEIDAAIQHCLEHQRWILVLGIAYKKNVDDMRESPSVHLMDICSAGLNQFVWAKGYWYSSSIAHCP